MRWADNDDSRLAYTRLANQRGLFLVRRTSTSIRRRISSSRPMAGRAALGCQRRQIDAMLSATESCPRQRFRPVGPAHLFKARASAAWVRPARGRLGQLVARISQEGQ
jgi:hypothetical protein